MGVLNYLPDPHLEFLCDCDNSELDVLVHIITKDKDGDLRDSEDLTLQEEYKKYYPDHVKYWEMIAADYQYFGGNTIANGFRGHGVLYEEILGDVCRQMKVNTGTVDQMESYLLDKIFAQIFENLSFDELKEMMKSANLPVTNVLTKQMMTFALQAAIRAGGFASYQITLIIINAIAKALVGHGLRLGANAAIARGMAIFAGPIGLIITGVWTAISLAGPAFRVTVPATIYIALLHRIKSTPFCKECDSPLTPSAKFCSECGNPQDTDLMIV